LNLEDIQHYGRKLFEVQTKNIFRDWTIFTLKELCTETSNHSTFWSIIRTDNLKLLI